MTIRTFIAVVIAVTAFLDLCMIGNGSPDDATIVERFAPLGAANGIGFGLAFSLGVPELLARLMGYLIVFGLPAIIFYGLRKYLPWFQQ